MDAIGMRERILELAAPLFVSHGYDGISMREIADASGISKAGLYYHFQDKEQLFLEILKENLSLLEGVIAAADRETGGGRAKVAYFVRYVFQQIPSTQRAIIRLANQEMGKVSPAARAEFDSRYKARFIDPLAAFFGAGTRSGEFRAIDPHLAVWGLLGLMYPFFNPDHAWQHSSDERVVDFILTTYFEGVNAHG
ncbi:MAG: TetR/AcrR family transcriptional regulator [Anaerolineaceae bacterium]|nr:TetR/AcrR family transcriptional regulator [Anaerolineaceae bacterium]